MDRRFVLASSAALAALSLIGMAFVGSGREMPAETALNRYVLQVVDAVRRGPPILQLPGPEVANSIGTAHEIRYLGQRFWDADPSGRAHCIGFVFQTYIDACERWARAVSGESSFQLGEIDAYGFRPLRRDFYVGTGATGAGGRSVIDALSSRGLGEEIMDLEEARAGDFVQFSRNNGTSHAAVFLGWEHSSPGERRGLRIFGVQRGRAQETTELIGLARDMVNSRRIFVLRAHLPRVPPIR